MKGGLRFTTGPYPRRLHGLTISQSLPESSLFSVRTQTVARVRVLGADQKKADSGDEIDH